MDEKIIVKSSSHDIKSFQKKYSNIVSGIVILCFLMSFINEVIGVISISIALLSMLLWLLLARTLGCYSLTITNKRAYGKTGFGKQVDLPIDSISAVGMCAFKGISIGTSSGRITFHFIPNRDEIHSELSKLLMERQQKETKNTVVENHIPQSSADELKKYKELLDSGIITQEEFDTKKKQLLGL